MKLVLFRIHLREDIDAPAYQAVFEQMLKEVSMLSGFRGIEGFSGEDGSELAVAWFDSDEAIAEWKQHPDHLVAQERGRREFFKSYEITIADTDRQYGWPQTASDPGGPQSG